MTIRQRLRAILGAGFLAWLASFAASIWFVIPIARENSFGDPQILLHELFWGFVLWAVWTLWLSALPTLILATPLALFLPPSWLSRHRMMLLAGTFLLALTLPTYKFGLYLRLLQKGDWDATNFWPYTIFCVVYSMTILGLYLRSVARALSPSAQVTAVDAKGCNSGSLRR
jgi:hypothetical protein